MRFEMMIKRIVKTIIIRIMKTVLIILLFIFFIIPCWMRKKELEKIPGGD